MTPQTAAPETAPRAPSFGLSPQQVAFFETFGFLRIPGLFRAEIEQIATGFEEVFALKHLLQRFGAVTDSPPWYETRHDLHFGNERITIPLIVDKSDNLRWLLDDPRVHGIAESLLGESYEARPSDGSLFYCDTSWHSDIYAAPMDEYHVKLSFYLDPVRRDTGAIRVIPGTNDFRSHYARRLREELESPERIPGALGVNPDEIPSWVLESDPGDLVVWNYRTIHGAFQGQQRRRLLSLNFRRVGPHPSTGEPGDDRA